jgi:DNA-binding NarL/FixJ family response regulator
MDEATQGIEAPERLARVALVEVHPLVRLGLAEPLAAAGVGTVADAPGLEELRARTASFEADVAVLDGSRVMSMHVAVGLVALAYPAAPIVVLVDRSRVDTALEALAGGVSGCVATDASVDEIVEAIAGALRGETYTSPPVARAVARRLRLHRGDAYTRPALTSREREVLALLSLGWENADIARALHLSPATIKHHLSTLYIKLDVDNRIQAAVRAVRDGLLET